MLKVVFRMFIDAGFYTLRKEVEIASQRVEEIRASAGLQQLEADLANLEKAATSTSLWDDRGKAQETLMALTDVKEKIKLLNEFRSQVEKCQLMHKLVFSFVYQISGVFDYSFDKLLTEMYL